MTIAQDTSKQDSPPDGNEHRSCPPAPQSDSKVRADWIRAVEALGAVARKNNELRSEVWDLAKVNTAGMQFVKIEAGTFTMGPGFQDNVSEPAHRVTISSPYFMSVTEVTNAQFERVFPEHRRNDQISPYDDGPAVGITWEEADGFCKALSKIEGVQYRLPTEAEWEYACRAGSTSRFCFGDNRDDLVKFAWWGHPYEGAARVASFLPNAWGLYDMHGNALEWCSDWFGAWTYLHAKVTEWRGLVQDPQGPASGRAHVLRGGYWPSWNAESFASTTRGTLSLVLDRPLFFEVFDRKLVGLRETIGFRVVREVR